MSFQTEQLSVAMMQRGVDPFAIALIADAMKEAKFREFGASFEEVTFAGEVDATLWPQVNQRLTSLPEGFVMIDSVVNDGKVKFDIQLSVEDLPRETVERISSVVGHVVPDQEDTLYDEAL